MDNQPDQPTAADLAALPGIGGYGQGMRFAIKIAPQHTSWPTMLDVFKEADRIDLFESAWNFDHFYPLSGNHAGPCLEGWTTLTALAQATSRIRLGCLVTGITYRPWWPSGWRLSTT